MTIEEAKKMIADLEEENARLKAQKRSANNLLPDGIEIVAPSLV